MSTINSPGFQPGDISDTEGYEEMIRNMTAMIRGMAGETIREMPYPKSKSEIKVPETCLGEEIAIKALKSGNFYFLQNQKSNSQLNPIEPSVHAFDVHQVRKDFPVLQQKVHGNKPLVWLDNAATSQKPNQVIDAISDYYRNYNSNIHRGAHELAARSTDAYEQARQKVQQFMGAASHKEIVFVRGATEGINLIAQTFGKINVGHGDEIILSASSHHANIVPWQMLAKEKGAHLKVIPFNEAGELNMDTFRNMLNPKVKIERKKVEKPIEPVFPPDRISIGEG